MRLVEILARELTEWPEGAHKACQARGGEIIFWKIKRYGNGMDTISAVQVYSFPSLADDFNESTVTREMWEDERLRGKEKEVLTESEIKCEIVRLIRLLASEHGVKCNRITPGWVESVDGRLGLTGVDFETTERP